MSSQFNQMADYWHYTIGANVIPADTVNKRTSFRWSEFKDKPIPDETHEAIKRAGGYDNGIAIMAGKLHRGPNKGKSIVLVDIDTKKGREEFLPVFGETGDMEKLAEKTIVEQHADNKEKAHVYFLSPFPFPNMGPNSKLGVEIKSKGEHGIVFCSPSMHKDGYPYQIMGTKTPLELKPAEAIEMVQKINTMYKRNGLSYLDRKSRLSEELKHIAKTLKINESDYGVISEGERHNTLISMANSILFRHLEDGDNLDKLFGFFREVNERLCSPGPLPSEEANSIWESALSFVQQNRDSVANNSQKKSSVENETKLIEQAAEEILSNDHFVTIEETKEILCYSHGVYEKGGDILVEKYAETMCGYSLSNHELEEIRGHIRRKTYRPLKEADRDINIINMRNGLYDIASNGLKPHSPCYFSVKQKPIMYDPKAMPKLFGGFLKEVLYPAELRTAIEAMAYTFYRDLPFEHFFKLFGYGANGKSVFTGLLTRLHGPNNVSNVSLLSLNHNRFALADLELKDINVDTELSAAAIRDTSLLKKLTGGRKQHIRIERKYQAAYDVYLYAKLFFNANTINESADQTAANYRREIIISFPNTFEGKKDNPHLLEELSSEEEKSGIFNVLMGALRNILKNNGIYLNEKTIEERASKHERACNPVKAFVSEAIEPDDIAESDYITKSDLYRSYRKYCKKHALAPKSIEALGRELKKSLLWQEGRETTGEKRRTCWLGKRLKPEFMVEDEQQLVTSYV
jgi:P4 family phage/plasmid primase-like protien